MKPMNLGKIRRTLLGRMAWITARHERGYGTEASRSHSLTEFYALKTLLDAAELYDQEAYDRYLANARERLDERAESESEG